jgi:hypothetical protein
MQIVKMIPIPAQKKPCQHQRHIYVPVSQTPCEFTIQLLTIPSACKDYADILAGMEYPGLVYNKPQGLVLHIIVQVVHIQLITLEHQFERLKKSWFLYSDTQRSLTVLLYKLAGYR